MYTENFVPEIEDKREKISKMDELRSILSNARSESLSDVTDFKQFDKNLQEFDKEFNKKHSDARDYQLYHLLSGSTPQGPRFDTDDHEIENYIRSLEFKSIVDSAMDTDDDYYDKLVNLETELKKKYPDLKNFDNYALHHLASGSSLVPGRESEFDLPGGEYEEFIRRFKKAS